MIAIDSDGCVFDTMEVKQHQHFHPMILKHWGLESLKAEVCAMADYINLRSPLRGSNRFVALYKTFELVMQTRAYKKSGIKLPWVEPLGRWIASESKLTHDQLELAVKQDPELRSVLEWSQAVNQDIAEHMQPIPPFDGVREALVHMRERADLVVVSLSPHHALQHEWGGAGFDRLVDGIAGLDLGAKPHQVDLAIQQGGYDLDKVLLMGDAPGDLKAARESGICFYPTLPGKESDCWRRFVEEDFDRFLQGTYRGEVEQLHIANFEHLLQDSPPQGF
ncbi:MAG: HAD hydrolase-like protein [Kiritimatiellae bacterium]|nr:HAD hydrolase-like protein [Kiritimatiellia bacterium]